MLFLGHIQPTSNEWMSVNAPINASALYLQFNLQGNIDDIYSICLYRKRWTYQDIKMREKSKRFYPNNDGLLLPLELPPPDISLNATSLDIEFLKLYKTKSYTYTEPTWSFNIFAIV